MNAMNNAVLATINAINNGAMGVVVEMTTTPTWQSKKNPYYGRVIKHTRIANIGLGVAYTNVVESHSNSDESYIPDAPKGMHYPTNGVGKVVTRKYLISNTNPDQLYLNLVYRGNESVKKHYVLDGVIVTDSAVIADIESHIRPSYASKKQLDYGVPMERIVMVNRPKFENIALITFGDRVVYRRDVDKIYSIAL